MTLADQAAMSGHDGQVSSGKPGRPKRRAFTAAYKARILAEYDALPDGSPERGALMRRERLYHSHNEHWRTQQEKGTLPATSGKQEKAPEAEELARLRAENKKLKARNGKLENELGRTRTALDIAGKARCCWRTSQAARTPARAEPGYRRVPAMEKAASMRPPPAGCSGKAGPRCTGSATQLGRGTAGKKRIRHPAELEPEEKERVLRELNSPRFADKSVAQAHTVLLDEGCLCSQAAMHRRLREQGASGERRAHAVHPAGRNPSCCDRAQPDMVLGHHEAERPGPGRLVPALRDHGHLLEKGTSLGGLADPRPGSWPGVHRARHRPPTTGSYRIRARRPRHLGMKQYRRRAYAKLNITQSHSRPHVERQPLLRISI